MRRTLDIFVLSVIAAFALSTAARAVDFGGIAARPANPVGGDERTASWFVYTLAPGETKKDVLIVENNTAVAQNLELYPADSAPTTGDGFALKQRVQKMDKVGSWIKLDKTELKLAPHAKEAVSFAVRVPADEQAGLWSGGIMVASAETTAKTAGVSFNIRLGVRMYVTVAQKAKAVAASLGPVAVVGLSATALFLAGIITVAFKRRRAINNIS